MSTAKNASDAPLQPPRRFIGSPEMNIIGAAPDDNQAALVTEPRGSKTFVHLDLPECSLVACAPSERTCHPGEGKSVRIFDTAIENLSH
ncbi:hypothetical protein JQ506_25125 (plasmid) [Shinella sp. PSBB067]|uniref:hypothetical protein n=1 Tax=Shinella sp. PSBB067 TaxID=2715959 RepID=UPI00193BD48D|nr:hypothetical protein [Shinella sp. PSBB067]QRI66627.1 hypothetical protein JQ506_25125 [Shinella sp. PSBB067]